jgi:hypothetical protein
MSPLTLMPEASSTDESVGAVEAGASAAYTGKANAALSAAANSLLLCFMFCFLSFLIIGIAMAIRPALPFEHEPSQSNRNNHDAQGKQNLSELVHV